MSLYQVIFSSKALQDVEEAASWYEEQKQGLGMEFTLKLEEAVNLLKNNPEVYRRVELEIRKIPLKKFPYAIFYEIEEAAQEVGIIAVIHNKRNPQVLKKRIKLK